MFGVTEITIKNGTFRPKGRGSIWLFVPKEKSPAPTQCAPDVCGNELQMDGQSAGLTHRLLIEHHDRADRNCFFFTGGLETTILEGDFFTRVVSDVRHKPELVLRISFFAELSNQPSALSKHIGESGSLFQNLSHFLKRRLTHHVGI